MHGMCTTTGDTTSCEKISNKFLIIIISCKIMFRHLGYVRGRSALHAMGTGDGCKQTRNHDSVLHLVRLAYRHTIDTFS